MAYNGAARPRAGRRGLWVVAGIAAAGAVAAIVGIWHLPGRMYPGGGSEVLQARAALQGGLLTGAAALTAVAGGLIALDETRRANRDTHVRELYVEAAKLLNDPDNLGVRLAGIYALERIAMDSPADHRTVVAVLSAFVRTASTDPARRPASSDEAPAARPDADISAAVEVLACLPRRPEAPTRADLRSADLTGPASLARISLWGADLRFVDLSGADLTDATLAASDLRYATLHDARLVGAMLYRTKLAHAHLHGADLSEAKLLKQRQVDSAYGDGRTRLPAGLVRPTSWTSDDDSDA